MSCTMKTTRRPPASQVRAGAVVLALVALGGCISVKAPEKPIEINLNVNIRQEVVVSLRKDVQDLENQYPGVF